MGYLFLFFFFRPGAVNLFVGVSLLRFTPLELCHVYISWSWGGYNYTRPAGSTLCNCSSCPPKTLIQFHWVSFDLSLGRTYLWLNTLSSKLRLKTSLTLNVSEEMMDKMSFRCGGPPPPYPLTTAQTNDSCKYCSCMIMFVNPQQDELNPEQPNETCSDRWRRLSASNMD